VLFEGMQPEDAHPEPARALFFRPGEDKLPVELPAEGDRSPWHKRGLGQRSRRPTTSCSLPVTGFSG
jgi:hypothetical protein